MRSRQLNKEGVSGWKTSALILMCCWVAVAGLAGCRLTPADTLIHTEHGSYVYYIEGNGPVSIVLESGLGDDMDSWGEIVSMLAAEGTVLRYNRAGFQGSHSRNKARHAQIIVDELHALLANSSLPPPYILVGHSLGGAYMELFAKTHPELVSGLLLIDPSLSQFSAACSSKTDWAFCEPPNAVPFWAAWFLQDAVTGEIRGMQDSLKQVNEAPSELTVPMVLLERPNADIPAEVEALRREVTGHLVKQSPQGRRVECAHCGHYIHKDHPQMVLEAVRWLKQPDETGVMPSD